MQHTWIEISREAFNNNIANIKRLIGNTTLGVVFKADAYGHGLRQMAMLAQEHSDIGYVFTAFAHEALAARSAGITKPMCILVWCGNALEKVIAHDIEFVCYNKDDLKHITQAARACSKQARIHLKIDTGMSRLGILPHELTCCIEIIKNSTAHIKLVGVMTHLCDADNTTEESIIFTQQQLLLFDECVCFCANSLSYPLEVVHACASAGTLFFSDRCSLVLMGECVYGAQRLVRVATNMFGYYKPSAQQSRLQSMDISLSLQPILTWKTRIIQIKNVHEGSFVGYNRTYKATRPTKIAIIPIGYFDGYPRGLSNKGSMIVRNKKANVIGRVSMNMCTLDVSDIEGVSIDDEVIIMGDMPGMTADDLAQKVGTINLDIFTGLHPAIERTII